MRADSDPHNKIESRNDGIASSISQGYEQIEAKGPLVDENFLKYFQDLISDVCKKEKLNLVLENSISPENLESFQITNVNLKIWRKLSHKVKTFDMKLQTLQNIVLKLLVF